ncbi:MAG: GerMN domain-containing protein [Firmicutes bacterium]|nr:GerMN domain-containing protein [Bacillota bacterium]
MFAKRTFFRQKKWPLTGKGVAIVFITHLLICCLFSCSCSPNSQSSSGEEPVEPLVAGQEALQGEPLVRGRFSVPNPEMKIFALSVSHNGDDILFSSEARTVSRLDGRGNLSWEIVTEGLPVCAALAEDGLFAAVGTEQGKVYYLNSSGHILWEISFQGKIEHLALNRRGDQLALSVLEEEGYILYCLDQWSSLLWEKDTGLLKELYFTFGGEVCYLEEGNSDNGTIKIVRSGELLWEKEARLAAFSAEGKFFVLYNGEELQYYRLNLSGSPELKWSLPPCGEEEVNWLGLTEEGRYLLAYNGFTVGNNNLWAFNNDGLLLWKRRIPSGALLDVSCTGERIVASSWQEYSEDVSKVMVLDNYGDVLQEVEMASRIEKNALSGDGSILVLAGSDGNLFILEIPVAKGLTAKNGNSEEGEQTKTLYRPVSFKKPEGESYLTLYFFDEEAQELIPVNRSVKASPKLLQSAVNELIKGPRSSSGLKRTIPKEVHINVTEKEGLAYVDLPEELDKLGGTTQVQSMVDSLVRTLSQFSSVQGIQFLLEGKKVSVFSGEGFMIDKVFSPHRLGKKPVLYLPYRSGDRYYLLPREADELMKPVDLVNEILRESYPFLSAKPRLKEIRIEKKEIVLDWDASFKELFPSDGNPKEKALAVLFTDALLLTLGENLPPDRLIFLVEGEVWTPPGGYNFSGEISRPFFINPE